MEPFDDAHVTPWNYQTSSSSNRRVIRPSSSRPPRVHYPRVTPSSKPDEGTPLLKPKEPDGGKQQEISPTKGVQFSRRKFPIDHAVRYLLEAMCTDLVVCGECFVLDKLQGQTLVTLQRAVPIKPDESLDAETGAFMEAPYREVYARGVGLPGLAWAEGKPRVVEILPLARDESFNPGGSRLADATRLFHSALIVPVYSENGIRMKGVWLPDLMGVMVLYFPGPAKHIPGLIPYAEAIVASAPYMSELMVKRSGFVDTRIRRVNRNMTVMKISIRFIALMLVRYKNSGRRPVDDARTNQMELGPVFVPSTVQGVLSSREAKTDEAQGGVKQWFARYIKKFGGGKKQPFPHRTTPFDAGLTWLGSFLAISVTELLTYLLNKFVILGGQGNLFTLSGSFGALCTLLNAVPSAALAQPRVALLAHSVAILVSSMVMALFDAGELVWFQQAFGVATTICVMAISQTIHPPAGALCLVILGAYNNGASREGILALFISVMAGVVIHIFLGVLVDNVSPRRQYPTYW